MYFRDVRHHYDHIRKMCLCKFGLDQIFKIIVDVLKQVIKLFF